MLLVQFPETELYIFFVVHQCAGSILGRQVIDIFCCKPRELYSKVHPLGLEPRRNQITSGIWNLEFGIWNSDLEFGI